MNKRKNPVAEISAAAILTEAVSLVDKLLSAYQRKKELEFAMQQESIKNEQELSRLENARIELIQVHKENMRKLSDIESILKSELLNNEAARQVFIQHSDIYLEMQKKLGEAAIMEDDQSKQKDLFDKSIQCGKLLQIACDNFQKESTRRYIEGPAILRSLPLNSNSVKKIGEK